MKIISLKGNSSFREDVPVPYRRSLFLALVLETFASNRVKRVTGRLGDSDGSCACAIGLFTDLAYANRQASGCNVDSVYSFPADAFPDEVRLLDRDFLTDVMRWNDAPTYWLKSGQQLTNNGRVALNRIVDKYGFRGISESTGLSKFL